jgi:hypothetical protein
VPVNAKQRAYVRRVEESNPAHVVEALERADGAVIVDVREVVRPVMGFPADGLRSRAQVLIDSEGRPIE